MNCIPLFAPRFALMALLSGCALLDPRPDPSRFFILHATETAPDGGTLPGRSIGLGPITIPDYLQRQELMWRTGPTEVRPSGVDRWAGTLDSNVTRVLAENLGRLLGTERLYVYPSFEITRADYNIEVSFIRFDLDMSNTATLVARWEVREARVKDRNVSRITETTAAASSSSDTAGGVEALSRTLGELSRDIGAVVRQLDAQK